MRISSFFYTVKQGFKNIWNNRLFSLASIATMAACIFMFGIFYSLAANFQAMVKSAEEGVAVTAFFDEGITEEQIQAIGDKIEKRAEVASYNYVSAEQAWEDFKKVYFQGAEDLADGFAEDNPLANSAHYEIYLNDVSMQPALVSFLEGLDGIREVNRSEITAASLTGINALIAYASIGIIAILFAVSIFLISNTVTIGISVRKEEISIMKYIGATDFFVRSPFVIEGMLIGAIGALIPMGIIYSVYNEVINYIVSKFANLSKLLAFLPVNEIFAKLLPGSLIMGIGIGFLGSIVTVRKHLRV